MRSDERGSKSVGFHVTGDRWCHVTASEGGVFHGFSLRSTTASFVYLPHSAVVSHFKKALPRPRAACRSGTRATPPKSGGACGPKKRCAVAHPFSALMTGRSRPHLSLREGSEQAPFPLALDRSRSVLAVKGSLRRFAPWTAPGRSERRAAYEGKGGVRFGPCGRAEREPFGHTRTPSRSRGALSPAGP